MAKERIRMENAPDWYDTPLEKLHFEWSPEELLEIERYCEKIQKNIDEEEMTPLQRFNASLEGREKDRCFMVTLPFNVYAVRTLDSAADALKIAEVEFNSGILPISVHKPMPEKKKEKLKRAKSVKLSEEKKKMLEEQEEKDIEEEGEIMALANVEEESDEEREVNEIE